MEHTYNGIFIVQILTSLFERLSAIDFHETLRIFEESVLKLYFFFPASLFKKECVD